MLQRGKAFIDVRNERGTKVSADGAHDALGFSVGLVSQVLIGELPMCLL